MNIVNVRWCALIRVVLLIGAGCSRDVSFAPAPGGDTAYWELRLNHHAVQLSLQPPHNTLQLETTMYTSTGSVWTPPTADVVVSPPIYVSRDSTKVGVAPDGTITARAVESGNVFIVAMRTVDGVEHLDSALVRVADVTSPPVLNAFTVRPPAGDSAKLALFANGFVSGQKQFQITLRDTNNVTLSGYPIYMTSSNPLVAQVVDRYTEAKSLNLRRVGEVLIQSETWVYGVAMTDTFTFTVGYPIVSFGFGAVFIVSHDGKLQNRTGFDLGPGGTLYWRNETGVTAGSASFYGIPASNGVPIDIIFEDPTNVLAAADADRDSGGGNIIGIPGDTVLSSTARTRYRRFLIPGTYRFRIMPFGTTGTVIVHDR